jgi:hypothetical protein
MRRFLCPALLLVVGTAAGREWVTGDIQRDSNFTQYVEAYTQFAEDQAKFGSASSVWYHCAARGLEVYTRNHDLSTRIRSLVHVQGSSIIARLALRLPRSFECQIYVYRDKAELAEHLPADLQVFELARWHEDTAALTYQLKDDGSFNISLLYNDVPYLLTLVLLEQFDSGRKMPAAVRYGLAFAEQWSLTNALTVLAESLAGDSPSQWMSFETLMTFEPDPRDEPALLKKFNLTAAALAAYLDETASDAQYAQLVKLLAGGTPPEQAFGTTLSLGSYDVVSRLEEEVYGWIKQNYTPAPTPQAGEKVSKHTTISIAVIAVVVAVSVTLLSWFRQLVT